MRTSRPASFGSRLNDERGSTLIQVAVALLALLALSSFVFDYGIMWASRGQAQNAADAAALSAAISRSFDYTDDLTIKNRAIYVAQRNWVWDAAPSILSTDIYIEPCPPSPGLPADTCIRAEVFRNQARGNPLATYFSRLAGVTEQGVRATATARGVAANAANCLRPWAVADKWLEPPSGPPWSQSSVYQPPADSYTPPSATTRGTGFSNVDATGNPIDHGLQLTLKLGHSGPPLTAGTMSAGWSFAIDLPNADVPTYDSNISGCTSATVGIATAAEQCTAVDPERGCLDVLSGGHNGAVSNPGGAFRQLMDADPGARWSNGTVVGSNSANSPRIVPVAIFDTDLYYNGMLNGGFTGTNGIVKVVNIIGFFIEGICSDPFYKEPYLDCTNNGRDIVGRLVRYSGASRPGSGTVVGGFGTIITLVR